MMANGWQEVPLKEVAKPINRTIPVEAGTSYRTLGVKWWGMGAYERETIDGSRTAAKTLSIVREGDLIINKIWVRHGSVAIATKDVDGCAGSGEFPTFELDLNRIDPRWIHWQTKMKSFWEKCDNLSRGTSGKNRIKPELFLTIKIPLPPLTEQRRIVVRIEALARRVAEGQSLRREASEETETLISSALYHIFEVNNLHWKKMAMPEAVAINDRQVDPTLSEYSNLPHISGKNIQSKTCKLLPYRTAQEDGIGSSNYLFSPNTILYSKIRPYLRKAIYVDFKGVCSADIYPIKVISPELEPRFVMWSMIANPFTKYANDLSGRTRMPKLNRKQLFAFTLVYPPLEEQRRLVAYLDGLQAQVVQLRAHQEETQKELSALMPSILDKAFKGEL
jgi:type I restriction enzyme S subunit